jgi:hypothetical protein
MWQYYGVGQPTSIKPFEWHQYNQAIFSSELRQSPLQRLAGIRTQATGNKMTLWHTLQACCKEGGSPPDQTRLLHLLHLKQASNSLQVAAAGFHSADCASGSAPRFGGTATGLVSAVLLLAGCLSLRHDSHLVSQCSWADRMIIVAARVDHEVPARLYESRRKEVHFLAGSKHFALMYAIRNANEVHTQ